MTSYSWGKAKNALPIATQKPALIQFALCRASRVATPKKSRNIVKLVPNLSLLISASVRCSTSAFQSKTRQRTIPPSNEHAADFILRSVDAVQIRRERLRAFSLRLVNFPHPHHS